MVFLYLFLFVTVCSLRTIVSKDVGQVYIGSDENDTTTLWTFNQNYESNLTIPLYVKVFNETTNEESVRDYEVNVTCGLADNDHGYTNADFRTSILPASTDSGLVSFENMTAGRVTEMRCWGESVAPYPVFTKETSISDSSAFEVRRPGTVSICDSEILVPRFGSSGSFDVELSEPVEGQNVTLECDVTDQSGWLNITKRTLLPDETKITFTMSYAVTPEGDTAEVYCTAESAGNENRQFIKASSTGRKANARNDTGTVTLQPSGTTLRSTRMQLFFGLSSKADINYQAYCYSTIVNDTEEADDVVKDPTCGPELTTTPLVSTTSLASTTRSVSGDDGSTSTVTDTSTAESTVTVTSESTSTVTVTETTTASDTTETAGLTGTTLPTTTSQPPEYRGEWSVDSPVIFQENDLAKTITVTRSSGVDEAMQELVVVRCCFPDGKAGKFDGTSAAMMVTVYLTPPMAANWTDAIPEDELEKETDILDPAFVEIGSCTCDMTENACDIGCCCDPDCSEVDKETFPCDCSSGVSDCAIAEEDPRQLCSSDYFKKTDWHYVTCVYYENSAFLGYYFYNKSAVRTRSEYDSIASDFRPDYAYKKEPSSGSSDSGHYVEGDGIRTVVQQDDGTVKIDENYLLSVPRRTFSGGCVWTSPVRFLVDTTDTCPLTMTEALCGFESPLNAQHFAQATTWSGVSCQTGPYVLQEKTQIVITTTNVDYYCAEGPEVERFMWSTETAEEVMPENEQKLFDFELDKTALCYFDPNTQVYTCEDETYVGAKPNHGPLPPRCGWDDGYSMPPIPALVSNVNCTNSVLDVFYNFTWRGSTLLLLNASVILGTIPLTRLDNSDTILTPSYTVAYVHQPTNSTPQSDNTNPEESDTVRYDRSGNPGYEWNKPVLSGQSVLDNETNILHIDASDKNRLSLWEPGTNGLCLEAARTPVLFGQHSITHCVLRLNIDELMDCDNLRRYILNRQDQMMASNYVSSGGDPDYENVGDFRNTTDWVQVVREDLSDIVESSPQEDFTSETTATTTVEMTTTEEGNETTWGPSYLESVKGRCHNIPSGITVDILYAEVGMSNIQPIYEIISAKVSYTLTTWQLLCSGGASTACVSGSSLVQTFTVSTSANFIKVPAQQPPTQSNRSAKYEKSPWYCESDTCWEELFYPWIDAYRGSESLQYTRAFGLAAFFFIIGAFCISRPWW